MTSVTWRHERERGILVRGRKSRACASNVDFRDDSGDVKVVFDDCVGDVRMTRLSVWCGGQTGSWCMMGTRRDSNGKGFDVVDEMIDAWVDVNIIRSIGRC